MRGPQSHFAGISRVEPGHLVIVEPDGRAHSRAWYEWRLDRQSPFKDDRETVEAFRSLFERAVADRLRAIGPVGSQLSSGFDSTAVTATAARLLAPSGKRLSAYTHVPLNGVPLHEPKGRIANEWPLAHTLAQRYPNIDHIAVEAADRQIGGDFDAQFFYTEVPIVNPCNVVWVYEIFRQAAQRKEKIVLSGGMGNATISQDGLPRLPELLLAGHLGTWWREAAGLVRHGHGWRGAVGGLSVLPLLPPSLVGLVRKVFGQKQQRFSNYSALRPDIAASASFRAHVKALGFDITYAPWRNRRAVSAFILRRVDPGVHHKGVLGAFGVEERDPTSDRRLVEFVSSLPSEMFLRGGVKKWLYRQAFADRIPPEILDEKGKGYQAADWLVRLRAQGETLRGHASEALGNDCVASLMDAEGLARLLAEPLPERADVDVMERYRLKLSRAISVAHFIRKTQRSNDPQRL
jgi:asparagine synthase (glutamine-hydrolysing)